MIDRCDQSENTLCRCLGVSRDQVQCAIESNGCASVCEVRAQTGAGGGCTACHRHIKALIRQQDACQVTAAVTTGSEISAVAQPSSILPIALEAQSESDCSAIGPDCANHCPLR